MDIVINVGLILLGFLLLVKGGDYLVDGAVAIAKRAKLSNMVIGLTIVGFGTSAPELLVSIQGALAGSPGIALGNVVGSNIANIALILGTTAIIRVCRTPRQTLRVDAPFMIAVCIALGVVGMTGTITRWAGFAAVALLLCFVAFQVITSLKDSEPDVEFVEEPMALWKAFLLVIGSIAALSFGSDMLVDGARELAKLAGVSERVIGLTIVAIGTSLPELFASVMAARKGETDMAIGNIIGSVTFNVLSVVGFSAVICPIEHSDTGFLWDYVLMGVLGVLLWFFLLTRMKLERWEGCVLLGIYVLFIARTFVM